MLQLLEWGTDMLASPRFIVSINGEHRCIAGFDRRAVLTVGLSHIFHGKELPKAARRTLDNVVHLHVSGLEATTHVEWLNEELLLGDELKVVVGDGGPLDLPIGRLRKRDDVASQKRLERRRERMAKMQDVMFGRLEVAVNGEHVCTAGVDGGVLTINLTWTWRDPQTRPARYAHMTFQEWESGQTDLFVGGLENGVHLEWHSDDVNVGDEVAVRLLGPGPVDEPQDRTPAVY